MKTRTQPANGKPTTKNGKATKATPEIPPEAIAKMKQWNEAHPEMKFSWIVVGPDTPPSQRACKHCENEFRNGRVTRLTSEGTYCGPRCQQKAHKAKAKAKAKAK